MAKGEQSIARGLLPEITPFPPAEIPLTGLGTLAIQQIQNPAQIVSVERLFSDIHVRGVSTLSRSEFRSFRLLAQFGFVGLGGERLLLAGLRLFALGGGLGLCR